MNREYTLKCSSHLHSSHPLQVGVSPLFTVTLNPPKPINTFLFHLPPQTPPFGPKPTPKSFHGLTASSRRLDVPRLTRVTLKGWRLARHRRWEAEIREAEMGSVGERGEETGNGGGGGDSRLGPFLLHSWLLPFILW